MNKFLFTLVAILLIATFAPADENATVKTGTLQIGGYVQTGYYSQSEKTTPPVGDSTTVNSDTFKGVASAPSFPARLLTRSSEAYLNTILSAPSTQPLVEHQPHQPIPQL